MTAIGIRDVAARAGVSPGTVSNVLNRPDKVASATRERVNAAIRELGFVRHGSASSLRAGRTHTIGLSVIDIGNPFFTEVAAGVEEVASHRGYAVIFGNSSGARVKEERNLRVLAEQRVGGVLITPCDDDLGRLDVLRDRGVAVVLLDHPAYRSDQCAVAVDDVAGGTLAVRHLIACGARHIAHVTGRLAIRQCGERHRGALSAAGDIPVDVTELDAMTADAGHAAAERMLAAGNLPDAVFCGNDLLALGMMRRCMQAGVRIPEDLLLIGYDDIDFAAASAVPLSSVRQSAHRLGRVAADLLLDEIESPGEHAHQQILFQPELVERESTSATIRH